MKREREGDWMFAQCGELLQLQLIEGFKRKEMGFVFLVITYGVHTYIHRIARASEYSV